MNKELMLTLVNSVIKVDRGGPESRVGKLLDVGGDHFTMYTKEDGVVYYKMQHVKSVTVDVKGGLDQDFEVPENLVWHKGDAFKNVIPKFRNQWVKVNRGGPEMLEGMLNEVENDYISVFSKDELVRYSMFHIRNISYGHMKHAKKEDEQEKNEGGKNAGARKRN